MAGRGKAASGRPGRWFLPTACPCQRQRCPPSGQNLGLYAERVGAISFVLSDADAAARVLSQLKRIARALYSNPPVHGARIVAEVRRPRGRAVTSSPGACGGRRACPARGRCAVPPSCIPAHPCTRPCPLLHPKQVVGNEDMFTAWKQEMEVRPALSTALSAAPHWPVRGAPVALAAVRACLPTRCAAACRRPRARR